jgi:D-serine deaminase-like pyridoxal phosphate-dependent protein
MKHRLSYEDCKSFLAGRRLPCAFVDLDAFDCNLDKLLEPLRDSSKTMRVASKSVRCVDLLKRIFERGGGRVKGVMCFTAEEADFLSRNGFDDLLVAYPTVQKSDLDLMAEMSKRGADVSVMVDCAEHVRALGAAGRAAGVALQAIVDVDVSYRPFGEPSHIGVRRSTVRTGREALELAREAEKTGGARVIGIMGYEAQIAGLGDENPFSRTLNPIRKAFKALSMPDVKQTRKNVADYLRRHGVELRIVNGGGTGSVDFTSGDDSCTEVTAGSGFYCPHLFSYFSNLDLAPAAFFALQAARAPLAGMVTCAGGGYIASGEMGLDRLPVPYLPEGGKLTKLEGAGEVQTPVVLKKGTRVGIGDPIIFRHAKAGELAERFNSLLLVQNKEITGEAKTYRGMGLCFM